MKVKVKQLLVMAVMLIGFTAIAQESADELYVKGVKHYYRGERETAVEYFQKASDLGNLDAMFLLGKCYRDGDGVEENEAIGDSLINKAFELGSAEAQIDMGRRYKLDEDTTQAIYWYQKAAEQGHVYAQYHLGLLYMKLAYTEKIDTISNDSSIVYTTKLNDLNPNALQDAEKGGYWLQKAAEQGECHAQYHMGVCYYEGKGVEQSYTEAVKWWQKSAEQGECGSRSMMSLVMCYYEGVGVSKDKNQAVYWFGKLIETEPCIGYYFDDDLEYLIELYHILASQNNVRAQCFLSEYYYEKNDLGQAKHWAKKAISSGQSLEFYNYSVKSKNPSISGNELKHDGLDMDWYKMWVELGAKEQQFALGHHYEVGYAVEQNYTEAVKWYRKAAEQGDADAQNNLGECYYNGNGVEQDYTEAVKWYRKAAERDCDVAQCNLGDCYDEGQGVPQSYTKAVYWYRKAAEQGHAYAQCNLGNCYDFGEGVAQDNTEAVKWYRKAAEQGYARAQNNLGNCYFFGEGVEQDYAEAVYWYRKAAEQGHAGAQNFLGCCYDFGEGVAQDNTEAVKWYRKAAEQGEENAIVHLERLAEEGNADAIEALKQLEEEE